MDLPTAALLFFFDALPFPEFDLVLYVGPFRVATVVPFWALIVWPMLLRLLLAFWADCPAADVDFWTPMLLVLTVLTLRPLLLLRPPTLLLPRLVVAELLVLPIELPMRELFPELTRALELGADRPAVLERTSTVLCTFEDLLEDLPATTCELRLEELRGVGLLT